jgi:hypothetical protein
MVSFDETMDNVSVIEIFYTGARNKSSHSHERFQQKVHFSLSMQRHNWSLQI